MVLPLFLEVSVGKSFWFIQKNDTIGLTLASMDPLEARCPEVHDFLETARKFTFTENVQAFKSWLVLEPNQNDKLISLKLFSRRSVPPKLY